MLIIKVQSNRCRTRTNAESQLQIAKALGLNTIVYNVHQGGAHYNSAYYTRCTSIESGFDPLGYLSQRGRELGINIYAWMCPGADCYQFNSAWDLADRYGSPTTMHWLNYSLPEARQRVSDIAFDIVSKYPVGISLDYIRYPDSAYPAWKAWDHFSNSDITTTVQMVREQLIGTCQLQAHVRAHDWSGILQDWFTWLQQDLVNRVMPMTYAYRPGQIPTWVGSWPTNLNRNKIVPTLALYDWYTQPGTTLTKSNSELQQEFNEIKSLGFKNFAIFDSNGLNASNSSVITQEAIMPIVNDLTNAADVIETQTATIVDQATTIIASLDAITVQVAVLRQLVTQLIQADQLADQLANAL